MKNASLHLSECISSIQNQSFEDWELIIVDDHSTDNSLQLLSDYQQDKRILWLKNEGLGIIAALETGFNQANGKWITRMDADDQMPPNRLEMMVNTIKHTTEKTVVTGLVRYISSNPISNGYLAYEYWINMVNLNGNQWKNIYRECVIASPNWMTTQQDLKTLRGFKDLSYPEDYDLVLKWYQNGFKVITIPEITLLWREHPARTSRTSKNYSQQSFFELKIKAFLSYDYTHGTLVIWGNNPKTTLVRKILKEKNIPFQNMDLSNYKRIEALPNAQLLIGVYPEKSQREKIIQYLDSIGLAEGQGFWFL